MHHHRRRGSAARIFASILAMALLAACAIRIEPPQDARLIAELEALALDTQTLFAGGESFSPDALEGREEIYARLAARAAAIRLLAEARPAPSGPISDHIRAATQPAEDRIVEMIGRAPDGGGEGGRDLSNATAAFMTDYLGALERLRARDRAAEAPGLPSSTTEIARLALEDALRDALFYERTILNRSR